MLFGQGYLSEAFGNPVRVSSKENSFLKLGQKRERDCCSVALFPFYNSDAKGGPDQREQTVNAQQQRWEDNMFYI